MRRYLATEPKVLASWDVVTKGGGSEYTTKAYKEFDSIADSLKYAEDLIRMGVAVHLEPLE